MHRALVGVWLVLFALTLGHAAHAANLRVVTFNAGLGKVLSLRSRSTIESSFTKDPRLGKAHVLALQELCLNEPEGLSRFIRLMQRNHGTQYHYADYAGRGQGSCGKGQAVIASYPIVDAGTLELPRVGARRVAVWTDLWVEGPSYQRLRVYNVHLSNRAGWDLTPLDGRLLQTRAVLEHAQSFQRRFEGAPILVLGDFNSLGSLYDPPRHEPAIAELSNHFRPAVVGFTPTMLLPYKVDWIFYSGLRYRRSKVAHVLFSDHFPVVADFDF